VNALREAEAELDEYLETSERDGDLIFQVISLIGATLFLLGFTEIPTLTAAVVCAVALIGGTAFVFGYFKVSDRTFMRKLNAYARAAWYER
jgi:hypothetical protein